MKSNNDKKWTVADVLTNFSKTQAQVQQEKQLKQQLKEALMQNQAQALGQFVPGMQQQMQPMQQDMSLEQSYQQAKQGGIHIDPSKKGTFKAQATRMGMGIQEAAAHILANRDEYTSGMVRKANFARNFAKEEGGETNEPCPPGMRWDPVLRDCVADTYNEAPTIQQIYNDPELLMRLKDLEHKRDVDEYGDWRWNQIFDHDTNGERFELPNGFWPYDEKGKEIPGGYPDTEFGKWLREFNTKHPAPNKIKDFKLPEDYEQNDGHSPTHLRYPQDLEFDFENMDQFQKKDYNEYIKFFQPDGTTPISKPQLQKQMGEDYDKWCPHQKIIRLSDGRTKKICVSYEESLAEYGGEMDEPCPNGTHWDPVLKNCVPDEKKPGVSPTREELFNDPEYRKNIDRLEYKRDVKDYLNYGEQKKDDYIKENYKGPRKQYDDGTLGPDVSPEWDQFKNSKEFQNLLKKFPWSIDGMLLEKDPGWQLPNDGPVNIEHYPLVGPWNKEDTKSYDNFFEPATNDYPENYDEDGNFLYKPKKVIQNSKELKEQLNNRYEDWCPCSKKEELMVNGRPTIKEVCIPCEQAEYGGEMMKYAGGGSPIWPPGRGKNKTYLTYSPFYGNSLTGQSSNMGYADNPFSDEKSDFFKVNTIRMPQSYIGISGGADPYGRFNHNDGIMKKLGYDAYVGLPYNYDPNNTDYYSNTPSVGGRIRYNNTIDNRMLGIPWNKVFVEASGDYSQSDGLNGNFSVGTRFDGKRGNSKGYFEPHIGVSGSFGPHGIKPGAYSANALAQYQLLTQSNDIPNLDDDSVNMSDPAIQNLISAIYNENIENPLAKGKKQQGAMADIDLGFKTGFEWSPKFLTKRLPGSKIFGDLRYTAQPVRGMFVSGMGENSQSNYAGQMGDAIIQSSDQGETNKLSFSHQFTGGLGLKVPIGTVKDKIQSIDLIKTRIPKDCMCPDGTKVDKLEDGSCPCDDYQIEECPPCPDGSVPRRLKDGTCPCEDFTYPDPDEWARHPRWLRDGGMIKRADGSYSQRGLWDNIRANAGSGKKPTREMLEQERKIRKKAMGGIMGPNNCQEGFEWNDIYQTCVPISRNFL